MNQAPKLTLVLLAAIGIPMGPGQAAPGELAPFDTITPVTLEPKTAGSKNRFKFSFQSSLNMTTRFKNIGAFPPGVNPGSTNGLSDHFYDDGYNRVDSASNQHFAGFDGDGNPVFTQGTWFWGFNSFSQVQNNGGPDGSLNLHSDSSLGGNSRNGGDSVNFGFEMSYSRELFRKDRWSGGVSLALNYNHVSRHDSSSVNGTVVRMTDSYSLFGNTLPTQDNYGQDAQGNPNHTIISDTPTRSFETSTTQVDGSRDFEAHVIGLKLGPYVEYALTPKVTLSLEAGLAFVYAYSDLRFDETLTVPDRGVVNLIGHGGHDGVLAGGYVGANVSYLLNDQWKAYAGAQWQDAGTYTHRGHGTREAAVLDLSNTIFINVGVGYTF